MVVGSRVDLQGRRWRIQGRLGTHAGIAFNSIHRVGALHPQGQGTLHPRTRIATSCVHSWLARTGISTTPTQIMPMTMARPSPVFTTTSPYLGGGRGQRRGESSCKETSGYGPISLSSTPCLS